MKVKNHVTVKLTLQLLEELGACTDGVDSIRPYLPLTLSTDPERNFKAAALIAQDQRATKYGWHDANWLHSAVVRLVLADRSATDSPWTDSDYNEVDGLHVDRNESDDVLIVMQSLAMTADLLATKAGR